jgi:hypothetical protein
MAQGTRWAIAALAVVAGGLCVGQYALWHQNKRTQIQLGYLTALAAATAKANQVDCRAGSAPQMACSTLSADDVRAIFREERGALAQRAPVGAAEATAKPSPVSDPVAFERGQDVVDRALATGAWGRTEANEFRALLPRLNSEQLAALMKVLLPSVNAQKIKVSVVGPLF